MSDGIRENAYLPTPSAEFLREFLPFSQFRYDLETEVFTFDRNFGPMIGRPSVSQMSLTDFNGLFSQGDRWHVTMFLAVVQEKLSEIIDKVFAVHTPDGALKRLLWSARLENNEISTGKKMLVGVFHDVSAQHRDTPDVSESERWFMEVLEESPHAMYRVDYRRNRFDYVSRGFARSLGLTREDILATPYSDFATRIHPEDMQRICAQIEHWIKQNAGRRFTVYVEFRYQLPTGDYIWLDDNMTIVPGPDGQYAYQVGFGAVIESRKRLEEQLQQARERLEEKVRERTSELHSANARLQQMMEERRELEKKLLEISERERRFIGRELHDGLSQQIVGVMCMFEAIRYRLEQKQAAEASELQMMRDYLFDAVQQVRALSRGLCPLALEPKAVGAALSTLAAQTTLLYKINCSFDGMLDLGVEEPDAALHLYRISQEAIQNAVRHGGAKNININLRGESADLCMQIENDGSPLSLEECETDGRQLPRSGIGLKLIDYRVGMLGGTWKIASLGDRGVRLTVSAPIRTEVI